MADGTRAAYDAQGRLLGWVTAQRLPPVPPPALPRGPLDPWRAEWWWRREPFNPWRGDWWRRRWRGLGGS